MIDVTPLEILLWVVGTFIGNFAYNMWIKPMLSKPKRKRRPEYDPYSAIDIEQAMLDRVDRAKMELRIAERDLYEYYLNKINNHAQPHHFIPTEDDMIRIEQDNKLLAYIREIKSTNEGEA